MASFLQVGNIVRMGSWTVFSEQASVFSVYYRVTAIGAPVASDQDMAANFTSATAAAIKALLSSSATYKGVQGQIVFPLPLPIDVLDISLAGLGTVGGSALPRQDSGIISWYTKNAGRKFRGRSYVPFPGAADSSALGSPIAGYVTRLNTLATAILNFQNVSLGGRTATVALGIFHRPTRTIDDVVTFVSRQKWATQRRRGDYGRGNVSPI